MKSKKDKKVTQLEHPIGETLDKAYSKVVSEQQVTEAVQIPELEAEENPVMDKKQYLEIINEVMDPETGVGIVDMGLIYNVTERKGGVIDVLMTLTSMGCPAGPQITTEIDSILRLQNHVKEVRIEIVWDPPWNLEMMNPDVKTMLFGNGGFGGISGFGGFGF